MSQEQIAALVERKRQARSDVHSAVQSMLSVIQLSAQLASQGQAELSVAVIDQLLPPLAHDLTQAGQELGQAAVNVDSALQLDQEAPTGLPTPTAAN